MSKVSLLKQTVKVIRNERLALCLTQKEFANFVGISLSAYLKFEQSGKITLEYFLTLLKFLKKDEEYRRLLDGFEFNTEKKRVRQKNNKEYTPLLTPIISASQKQIVLDKQIFGNDIFYSVQDGHIYEIPNFISIVLSKYDDKRLSLLIKYFGENRLRPYILKEKNLDLLNKFNKHINFLKKRNNEG